MLKSKSLLSIVLISLLMISIGSMMPLAHAITTIKVYVKQGNSYLEGVWVSCKQDTVWQWQQTALHNGPPPYAEFTVDETQPYEIDCAAVMQVGPKYYRAKAQMDAVAPSTKLYPTSGRIIATPSGPATEHPRVIWEVPADSAQTEFTVNYGRAGPKLDVFRGVVIKSPDAALIAMQIGTGDTSMGLIRVGDVEKLQGDGDTVVYAPGFHMGHIGYNMRSLAWQQANRRPELLVWPLEDVGFRHALFHCYDQEAIVASIYGYTVTPVQSLVPPSQGGWVNPLVPKHPYNPGDPFTSPPTEHSSCGILKAAGYVFVDAGLGGVVDGADYWTKGGYAMPHMELWTPTYETAPTSAEHGARFMTDLGEIGLAATDANGQSGFEHVPSEFADYMDKVDAANFDAYMVFWSLGRFPDHLYDMCHSSQICGPDPISKGKYNKPGINDPDIDAATYILKTSLDHDEKLQAAYDAQEYLYDENRPNAMGYMQLYSRIYFDAYNVDLRGVVLSPGYGSDIGYTHMNLYWAPGSDGETAHTNPDGTTFVNWIEGEVPERLNPCYASTVYAWDVMSKTLDGLLDVNPYTHEDLTSMSSALPLIEETGDPDVPMAITYYIRPDIFWQDGNPYTAHDAKFNWEFFKYNEVPRYTTTWMYIDHVDVIDDYTVKVYTNMTSQFLVYDIAGLAAYLPPNVWAPLNNTGLPNILAYDPSTDTNAAGMGPWFGTPVGPSTRLFGTGPWVFDYYDEVGQVWEVHQFPGYFQLTEEISANKATMFHAIGDVYGDGIVWADDRGAMGGRYGAWWWQIRYSAIVDVTEDGKIDFIDLSYANFHFGEQKEWP